MKSPPVLGLVVVLGVVFLVQAGPTQSTQNTSPPELIAASPVAISAATIQSPPEPAPTPSVAEPARAQGAAPDPADRQLYFGEQHLHSQWSPAAYAAGTRQKPEDAYRWAMGEEITLSTTGEKLRKATPYDFVAP